MGKLDVKLLSFILIATILLLLNPINSQVVSDIIYNDNNIENKDLDIEYEEKGHSNKGITKKRIQQFERLIQGSKYQDEYDSGSAESIHNITLTSPYKEKLTYNITEEHETGNEKLSESISTSELNNLEELNSIKEELNNEIISREIDNREIENQDMYKPSSEKEEVVASVNSKNRKKRSKNSSKSKRCLNRRNKKKKVEFIPNTQDVTQESPIYQSPVEDINDNQHNENDISVEYYTDPSPFEILEELASDMPLLNENSTFKEFNKSEYFVDENLSNEGSRTNETKEYIIPDSNYSNINSKQVFRKFPWPPKKSDIELEVSSDIKQDQSNSDISNFETENSQELSLNEMEYLSNHITDKAHNSYITPNFDTSNSDISNFETENSQELSSNEMEYLSNHITGKTYNSDVTSNFDISDSDKSNFEVENTQELSLNEMKYLSNITDETYNSDITSDFDTTHFETENSDIYSDCDSNLSTIYSEGIRDEHIDKQDIPIRVKTPGKLQRIWQKIKDFFTPNLSQKSTYIGKSCHRRSKTPKYTPGYIPKLYQISRNLPLNCFNTNQEVLSRLNIENSKISHALKLINNSLIPIAKMAETSHNFITSRWAKNIKRKVETLKSLFIKLEERVNIMSKYGTVSGEYEALVQELDDLTIMLYFVTNQYSEPKSFQKYIKELIRYPEVVTSKTENFINAIKRSKKSIRYKKNRDIFINEYRETKDEYDRQVKELKERLPFIRKRFSYL
ncbi:uncharacterized protein CMU_016210 [Cryptosporidium muris RN66]|uniref:Uncharacterized protein n=1 Tax=Cryptosporidium muris (strain RN66) TaxID=441375 RepID=B6ACL8_CRYMR|nr:uncharacterized protein CMU_016210 [Cryptosporidium muris RN66]EEA05872.1 hypothetical protein CMU_016210 [Cryptosporidium muris RN66]|eukprot:XP_002140221.1 hypothetical protein [Cryptosporidium muris RN66]